MPEEVVTPVKRPRAPRKRVATSDATPTRAPRRTVAKKAAPRRRATATEETISEPVPEVVTTKKAPARKAPTPIATERIEKTTKKKHLIIASVLVLCGIGASAAVGFSDGGKIDVNQTIQTRNDRLTSSGELPPGETIVPVQNTTGQPNGGLRGRGVGTKNIAPATVDTASSTATTTATTTELAEAESAPSDSDVTPEVE